MVVSPTSTILQTTCLSNSILVLADLEPLESKSDISELKGLIERHATYTGSEVALRILEDWRRSIQYFVKVMPRDYKRVLQQRQKEDGLLVGATAS